MTAARRRVGFAFTVVSVGALAWAAHAFAPDLAAGTALLSDRLGLVGFAGYLLYTLAGYAVCGAAWWVTTREPARRLGAFVWSRVVREATADLLPFSQVGGIVIGANVLVARGLPLPLVYASFVADLMTEIASQLLLTLPGLAFAIPLLASSADDRLSTTTLATGAGLLAVVAVALLLAPTTLALAQRVAARVVPATARVLDETVTHLRAIYARPSRLGAAFGFNLVAWCMSACGAGLVLMLMGVDVPFARIVCLEFLITLVRSTAFAIPAGIGVQEAGYGLLGPALGLPVDAVLAIALVKRLRDLAIAAPVVVAWQAETWWRGRAVGFGREVDG